MAIYAVHILTAQRRKNGADGPIFFDHRWSRILVRSDSDIDAELQATQMAWSRPNRYALKSYIDDIVEL